MGPAALFLGLRLAFGEPVPSNANRAPGSLSPNALSVGNGNALALHFPGGLICKLPPCLHAEPSGDALHGEAASKAAAADLEAAVITLELNLPAALADGHLNAVGLEPAGELSHAVAGRPLARYLGNALAHMLADVRLVGLYAAGMHLLLGARGLRGVDSRVALAFGHLPQPPFRVELPHRARPRSLGRPAAPLAKPVARLKVGAVDTDVHGEAVGAVGRAVLLVQHPDGLLRRIARLHPVPREIHAPFRRHLAAVARALVGVEPDHLVVHVGRGRARATGGVVPVGLAGCVHLLEPPALVHDMLGAAHERALVV